MTLHLYDYQSRAVDTIIEHFEAGSKVVMLDAPPGCGKTWIAEGLRQKLGASGLYLAHSRVLQKQLKGDFPHAEVLEGKANYPVYYQSRFPGATCDDCTGKAGCQFCPSRFECPYKQARNDAVMADLACLNYDLILSLVGYANDSSFCGRGLVVCDEGEILEDRMMSHVSVRVSRRIMERFRPSTGLE